MKKVLGLVQGEYSSHTAKIVEICKALRNLGNYEIEFSGNGQFMSLAESAGFPIIQTKTLTKERINRALEKSLTPHFYSDELVEELYKVEHTLLQKQKPDIIIRDHFREIAGISAKVHGIYDVTVQQGPANHNYHFVFRPETFPKWADKVFPEGSLIPIARGIEFFVRRSTSKPLHKKAKSLGLKLERKWPEGVSPDLVLLTESPLLYPNLDIENNIKYLGPMIIENDSSIPDWINEFTVDNRRKIIVTAGTTGIHDNSLLFTESLSDGRYAVAFYTNTSLPNPPKNFYGNSQFNISAVLSQADLFITHGGIGSTYRGLWNGTPMIPIHNHLEQHANTFQLEKLGVAKGIGHLSVNPQKLRQTIDDVISSISMKQNSERVRQELHTWPVATLLAADYIKSYGFKEYIYP